jgi:pimeloyl-ACP methyl ester carboxylesterase
VTDLSEPIRYRQFFISDGRPLYSLMHRDARPGTPLVVFCHGFAQEHVFNWRAEVLGAQILARRGYATLSYHARAHGDSAGEFADLTFEALVRDALAAAEYACDTTGASRIAWVGIRFGGLIAASAMRRRADTSALALWEPVLSAREYFRALMRRVLFFEVSRGRRPAITVDGMIAQLERGEPVSLLGFDLHPKFFRSIADAELLDLLETWSGPAMLAQIRQRNSLCEEYRALQAVFERAGAQLTTALIDEEPVWDSGFESWGTLEDLSRQMVEWLDGLQ